MNIHDIEIQAKLLSHCCRITGDAEKAQDLRQEVNYYAFRAIDRYKENGKLMAWLRLIARNVYINWYRREKKRGLVVEEVEVPGIDRNEGEYFGEVEDIWKKVERLPVIYRRPIEMLIAGATYEEIEKEMDVPMGTVKGRIHFARKKLAQMLGL